MVFSRIVVLASIALSAAASSVNYGSDYGVAPPPSALISSAAPVVGGGDYGSPSQVTVAPVVASPPSGIYTTTIRKCKKYKKKTITITPTAAATPGAQVGDDALPQLIGSGGFQVIEDQPAAPPAPPAAPPAAQEPATLEPAPAPAPAAPAPAPAAPAPVVDAPAAVVIEPPASGQPSIPNPPAGGLNKESFCQALLDTVSDPIPPGAGKDEMIRRTNNLRRTAGRLLGFNLPDVTYRDAEETTAEAYAANRQNNACRMEHSDGRVRGSFGENLASWSGDVNGVPAFTRHIEALRMYTEECSDMVDLMNFGRGGVADPGFQKYGHLTQLLWHNSVTVGCAFCEINRSQLSICHYGPSGGNVLTQNVAGQTVR